MVWGPGLRVPLAVAVAALTHPDRPVQCTIPAQAPIQLALFHRLEGSIVLAPPTLDTFTISASTAAITLQ